MSKHLPDQPLDSRPTKQQKTDPESRLELLGEDSLPLDMDTLNEKIYTELHETFPEGILLARDEKSAYDIIQRHSNGLLKEFNEGMYQWLFINLREVHALLNRAYAAQHDVGVIMRIKELRKPEPPQQLLLPSVLQVEKAWDSPFIGNSHHVLIANVRAMYTASLQAANGANDRMVDMSCTSIVQSSGSGKSRMVDEVAKHIFTIPFNIREAAETKAGAWPPPDNSTRDWLLSQTHVGEEGRLSRRYLCFFRAVFEQTTEFVRELVQLHEIQQGSFASCWGKYLIARRAELHASILTQANVFVEESESFEKILIHKMCETDGMTRQQASSALDGHDKVIQNTTQEALSTLVSLVRPGSLRNDPQGLASASTATQDHPLHVLMYFDEAHVLSKWPSDVVSHTDKVPLDVLVKTLDRFQRCGAFTVLLSTQSNINLLAPSSSYARSGRCRQLVRKMHVPITETPFDCIVGKLTPSQFKVDVIDMVGFMAIFGRPLWRSMLSQHLPVDTSNSSTVEDYAVPDAECDTLLALAHTKLLCKTEVDNNRSQYLPAAQVAVIDDRIMLAYEGSRHSQQHEMDLVASHMRTVYSIPRDREYVRSGYPSEPILAEAAARQLATWRRFESQEPAVAILRDNLQHDLLARGEIGEAVGRLLLTLAHDHAVMDASPTVLHFSRSISVEAFFRALYPEEIAERVLDSVPDNRPNGTGEKLRDAYKKAVLNFTHFGKWADDSSWSEHTAVGCFMRHMGIICQNNGAFVDVILPVLLDRDAPLGPKVMSGIFVQFKLRQKPGSLAAYAIDEERLGFFSHDEETPRPYITLIMELSVVNPPPPIARVPTKVHSKTAKKLQEQVEIQSTMSASDPQMSPSRLHVRDPPARGKPKGAHPRYSMSVYGCSPSVYKVIKEEDRDGYKEILRSGDLLGEHPRQDPDSLRLVRNQKPFFAYGAASWCWLDDEYLNGDEPTAVEGDGLVYIGISR
ncbi:hypothetical protein C8Q74DRAFT_1438109 [Fomes fomentarius]|nr:hypothetical protein C8Q74DRAFT_1438109 [Fomes fomentarius]